MVVSWAVVARLVVSWVVVPKVVVSGVVVPRLVVSGVVFPRVVVSGGGGGLSCHPIGYMHGSEVVIMKFPCRLEEYSFCEQ